MTSHDWSSKILIMTTDVLDEDFVVIFHSQLELVPMHTFGSHNYNGQIWKCNFFKETKSKRLYLSPAHRCFSEGGKLRRKGSRMSMERYKRQMKPSGAAISEGEGNGLPGFLKKTTSNLSQDSTSSKTKDCVDAIVEQTELDGGKTKGKKTESNGSDSQSCSPKKDEGLGESFEQSESESSLNSKSNLNGIKNAAYDAVPEELVSEDGSLREPRGSGSQSDKGELPLDASKLPKGDAGAASGSEQSSPRDDGGGSPDGHGSLSKKVSFYGSNDNTEGEEEAPVTETYVYRGKPKSRFGGRRRR